MVTRTVGTVTSQVMEQVTLKTHLVSSPLLQVQDADDQ